MIRLCLWQTIARSSFPMIVYSSFHQSIWKAYLIRIVKVSWLLSVLSNTQYLYTRQPKSPLEARRIRSVYRRSMRAETRWICCAAEFSREQNHDRCAAPMRCCRCCCCCFYLASNDCDIVHWRRSCCYCCRCCCCLVCSLAFLLVFGMRHIKESTREVNFMKIPVNFCCLPFDAQMSSNLYPSIINLPIWQVCVYLSNIRL